MDEGQSLSMKSLVRLTDRPDMTMDVYRGRKTTTHTNTLFPRKVIYYTCLCIAVFPSMVNLPLVHGYRSDQAKPATGTVVPQSAKVYRAASGRKYPSIAAS